MEGKLLQSLTKYVQTNLRNQVKQDFYGTIHQGLKINKCRLNCNFKKNVFLSEWNTCENSHVSRAQTKLCLGLNNTKVFTNTLKLRNEKQKSYFKDIIYKISQRLRRLAIYNN